MFEIEHFLVECCLGNVGYGTLKLKNNIILVCYAQDKLSKYFCSKIRCFVFVLVVVTDSAFYQLKQQTAAKIALGFARHL